ncbi:CNNM domain-containing protein [Leptolyngbya sp. NIES-2104]|uniref:CNNM domain-containing protein n=1 Tax=Leptolyngbya sp. NIES-2104 TaxID=1552121 RepID=UPI0006EC9811|nr:CNNM domain-containing protein [Leptolyngbya sp. NIES-2104]GAP96075.1 hemolysin and related proteins containing CBS domains [Leptolyngbya sp. NIES-2104]
MTTLETFEIETAETLVRLAILLLFVVFVAFFVAAELSIVSASKGEIDSLARQSNNPGTQKAAQLVQKAQNNLGQYLSVTQTGTTAGSLLLGWIGEGATVHWIEPWIRLLPIPPVSAMITTHTIATAIAFLIVTYIEIVLGELVPKVLAAHEPEKTALLLIRPLQICSYLFFPALVILNATVRLLTGWITDRDRISEDEFIRKDEYSVLVSGTADISTLNEQLNLSLPASDAYRTAAGFMIHHLKGVPSTGDRLQWGELEFEATRVVENQIETLLLRQVTRPLELEKTLAASSYD